jgi:hypothetical protein
MSWLIKSITGPLLSQHSYMKIIQKDVFYTDFLLFVLQPF